MPVQASQNNLRQISVTTFMYCQDNNDYLPFAWYDDSNAEDNNFLLLLTPIESVAHSQGAR